MLAAVASTRPHQVATSRTLRRKDSATVVAFTGINLRSRKVSAAITAIAPATCRARRAGVTRMTSPSRLLSTSLMTIGFEDHAGAGHTRLGLHEFRHVEYANVAAQTSDPLRRSRKSR